MYSLSCQSISNKTLKNQNFKKSDYFIKVDDWIFFSNLTDENKIYKIKTDLSQKVKVSDEVVTFNSPFIISNDWIYYSSPSDNRKKQTLDNNTINKIQIDGTNKSTIVDTPGLVVFQDIIAFYQNWIYYLERGKNYILFRIRPDGSEKEKLRDGVYFVNMNQEWIVYQDLNDNNSIYKMRLDGSEETKLNNEESNYLVLDREWVYYISKSHDVLQRVNLQSKETELVISQKDLYPDYVDNGWIYYSDGLHKMDQYRFNLEEKKIEQISGPMNDSSIIDNNLYYFTYEDPERLFQLNLDTLDKIKID